MKRIGTTLGVKITALFQSLVVVVAALFITSWPHVQLGGQSTWS